jgi:hypothetical protein
MGRHGPFPLREISFTDYQRVQCRQKATELGDDPSKTVLSGGSAGAMLCAQVAYSYMVEGNHDIVTGCVLLFPVTLSWKYDGKYKEIHTAWEENGHAQTPVFGLELAKFIWCKCSLNPLWVRAQIDLVSSSTLSDRF